MSSKRNILIVDDLEEVGNVASEYLERRVPNVQVYETVDPLEALEWLKAKGRPRVDLLLSDNKMPKMDGLTFLREARPLVPDAAIALMTAYLDLPTSPSLLAASGVHALIKKPWQWSDFAVFVNELLSMGPAGRASVTAGGPLQFPEGAFQDYFDRHRRG